MKKKAPDKRPKTPSKPKLRKIKLNFTLAPSAQTICDELIAMQRNLPLQTLYLALNARSAEMLQGALGSRGDMSDRLRFQIRDIEVCFPPGHRERGAYGGSVAGIRVDSYNGFPDYQIGNLTFAVQPHCRGSGTLTLYESVSAPRGGGRP